MFTFDPETEIGQVRLIVPDRVMETAIFSDEELTALLALEGGVRRAAALAMETIAVDQALTLKVIQIGTTRLDGASVARTLLGRAASLRAQAEEADAASGSDFEIAEIVTGPFSARERLRDEWLRGA